MSELQIFNNEEFGQIRTVTKDNEPWFVASDIAKALGYRMASDLVRRIDDDDKGTHIMSTQGGEQAMLIINESGFYSSILNSKLESAKRFKHWVTSEVLPSIRKNGGYIANQENLTPEQIVANALVVAQNIILQKDRQIKEMQPKADFFDCVADSKSAFSMNEVAKVLDYKGIGRNKLFEFLREQGILDRYNVPYQRYVDNGWFRVIEQKYMKDGEPIVTTKTLVYQKGVDAIRKRLEKGENNL
jgi:prophage antirepressor-like protein